MFRLTWSHLKYSLLPLLLGLHLGVHAQKIDIGDRLQLRGTGVQASSGRPMVIAFWGTWCEPCKEEIPVLNQIAKEGLASVTGIALERGELALRQAALANYLNDPRSLKPEYKTILDQFDGGPLDRRWIDGVDWFGIPVLFVLDKNGRLAFVGGFPTESLHTELDKILEQVRSGKWDYQKAKANYQPVREAHIIRRNDYRGAENLKKELAGLNPSAAYKRLIHAIEASPGLLNYLTWDRIKLALAAGEYGAASRHIGKVLVYGRSMPHILSYFVNLLSTIPDEKIGTELKKIKIEVAEEFVMHNQGIEAQTAFAILRQEKITSVCRGDLCVPIPDLSESCQVDLGVDPKN